MQPTAPNKLADCPKCGDAYGCARPHFEYCGNPLHEREQVEPATTAAAAAE